ncbi:NAD(P)/FAD-dependent oxidoreductase [Candidatus Peregrinibacteria bacterium]|nr:NAD(P)/FAD-dependent oxidoreductase [Candidatus Peregrinibacteria bacterium]
MYDVVIIGAGPAGWSAAIYTARAGLQTVLLGILKNSNAYKAHVIENYFGYEKQISGPFLMEEGKKQALKFGTQYVEREVVDVKQNDDGTFTATDTERDLYTAKTVVVCSGLGFKPSGIKNEQPLIGKGISFCVTCDGFFFKEKNVAVVGNANYAGEEALQLLTYTKQISILSHGKDFSFSPKIQEGLEKNGVNFLKTPKITEFIGAAKLEKLKFADGTEAVYDGVFVALGVASASDFANKLGLKRTGPQNAYIVADPRTGATNVKGVYAAGDCTGGNAQAAKSAGEGCNAAISVIKLLKGVAAYVDYS